MRPPSAITGSRACVRKNTPFTCTSNKASNCASVQFQKQLRLIEARRMMLSEGASASGAAHAVGYESVPQFTREYGRLFGAPPVRDIKDAKTRVRAAA